MIKTGKKFTDHGELKKIVESLRNLGSKIVLTQGSYDLVHIGHARYLDAAKKEGDVLIVGINDDDSVGRLKGAGRPIVPVAERAEVLASLRSVDFVIPFSEDTPLNLLRSIQPDVLVKGGDYDPEATSGPKHIVGSEEVRERGGHVQVVSFVEGVSTTSIVDRLSARHQGGG